jgi:hypothetical protein
MELADGGFGSLVFGQKVETNPQKFYQPGEKMKSQIVTDPTTGANV